MNILHRRLQKFFHRKISGGPYKVVALCLLPPLLLGCAGPNVRVQSTTTETQSPPSTVVYYYANDGQSQEQQDRDRYECYLWAVDQTGYEPGQQQLAPHQRVEVQPSTPPGTDVAVGAATGALLGSIIAGPHRGPGGLVFGVLTGAILGLASETGKQQQAENIQQQYDDLEKQQYSQLEKQANDYKRAMSACLEGKNYTVQ